MCAHARFLSPGLCYYTRGIKTVKLPPFTESWHEEDCVFVQAQGPQ